MKKYSAKLLFQFRVKTGRKVGVRRICEERIIHFDKESALFALAYAKKIGKKCEYKYKNADGGLVKFEFIGIIELICCDLVCQPGEVWYDIVQRVRPMERKASLIPREACLSAIVDERRQKG